MLQNAAHSKDRDSRSSSTSKLLVLDPRAPGWQELLIGAGPATMVLVLDQAQDGLAELAEVAAGLAPLASITLCGPADPGWLRLGSALLDGPALAAHRLMLAAIGQCLEPDGFLQLDGAAGQGLAGQRLLVSLAAATGREVFGQEALEGEQPLLPLSPWPVVQRGR
ncbi:hypothetical protein BKE38_21585 [Pseudoroseomonas deserti]|uniref:DUF4347 domain-containing protein n=1 Tax=Teichococcus deserti TaxID=1817963 RepID=A0A1V2GXR1_9PROT|nr:DUF4347 domain-containing protein [Pseudoroseomonas deserti]ONG48668.1 hypothetical protein BKE38_21585 [Pseudoroseomonas deserti]